MAGAAGIESAAASRTSGFALQVFIDGQLSAAAAAQNCGRIKFAFRPDCRRMLRAFGVAFVTRKPSPAAFEFDGDNVEFAAVMGAARLGVNFGADDAHAVN